MADNVAEVILRIKPELDALEKASVGLKETQVQAEKTQEGLNEIGAAVHAAGADLEDLDHVAGKTGQSAQKLAGALSMVSPEAGAAAMAVADLADIGEVAAVAAEALGVTLGTLTAVVGPLALIVAGVALAWHQYTAEAEAAKEAQAKLNTELDQAKTVADAAKSEVDKLRVNLGQLSQAEYDDEQIRAKWAKTLEDGTASLQADREAIVEQMNAVGTIADGAYPALSAALEDVDAKLAAVAASNQDGLDAALMNAEIARETAESNQVLADRLKTRTTAHKAATAATKADTSALGGASAEYDMMVASRDAVTASQAELAASTSDGMDLANEYADMMSESYAAVADSLKEAADAAEDLAKKQAAAAQAQAGKIDSVVQTASSAGDALLSGSVSGLASSLGPAIGGAVGGPVGAAVGKAVGAALSFLEKLGKTSIAEIKANLQASMESIKAGLKMVPELLKTVIPDLVSGLASAFIQALPSLEVAMYRIMGELAIMPIRMAVGFVKGLGEWWQGMGGLQGVATAIWDGLRNWWASVWTAIKDFIKHPFGNDRDGDGKKGLAEAKDTVKDALSWILTGKFDTGTDFVPRTGLALVHQGERITPATGRNHPSLAGGGGGGGGDVHIHLSGFAVGSVDELVRKINQSLGDANRRLKFNT